MANTQHREIEAFGWGIYDRIRDAIEFMIKTDIQLNMSNKEK